MGSHYLFLSVANHGSIMPTLPLVAELTRRGHRVTYVTWGEYAPAVARAGAVVVEYDSPYASANPAEVFADPDPMRPHQIYIDENVAIMHAAQDHVAGTLPDLIAYGDSPILAGQILARAWQRPACRLFPGFGSNQVYSYHADMIAKSGGIESWVQEAIYERVGALLARYAIEDTPAELYNRIEDFNLVFIPREFQIAAESFDARFAFVGRFTPPAGDWQPPADGLPVVLVSLGTTFNDRPELYRACAEAFDGAPWHAVLTTGDRLGPGDLGAMPPNVEAHRWVPYGAVLAHAKVFVTNGGMGAVMESVGAGRPMVAVPQSFDAMPMAGQVARLGLGVMIEPGQLTAGRLRAAVQEVAGDQAMLARVREMAQQARLAGGAARAASELTAYLSRSRVASR
jgi:dTDP-L-oleandrosyltransferase